VIYSVQIVVSREASDHSEITQTATELTAILSEAGYGHVSTTILDPDGDVVADFARDE
jgi:hypothetical protein